MAPRRSGGRSVSVVVLLIVAAIAFITGYVARGNSEAVREAHAAQPVMTEMAAPAEASMRPMETSAVEEERLREAAEGGGPEPEAATPDELDEDAPGGGEGGALGAALGGEAPTGCAGGLAAVVMAAAKDAPMLEMCLASLARHAVDVKRLYVVAPMGAEVRAAVDAVREAAAKAKKTLTLVDELAFPFNRSTVHAEIERRRAARLVVAPKERPKDKDRSYNPAWYLQQLLKLYVPYVLDGVSDYVIVDSDVVFFRPVRFGAAPPRPGRDECFSRYSYAHSYEYHRFAAPR